MRKSYQGKHWRRLAAAVCGALVAGTAGFASVLYANPVLDSKDGAVSISGLNTANVNITSEAANNVIKWVDFSIGSGEKVTFDTNNYLNYVTGHARSDILGTLTGGGNIYLVNPNGILIGDGAIVDVGSLHLSTKNLDVSRLTDYNTGLNLLTSATAAGDVINMGKLNADVISVEGNNITFKNVADVNSGSAANVTLTAGGTGEIHIGSAEGGASGYTVTSGTTYNYKLVRTKEELQNMQNKLDGNYMLADNIDMSGAGDFTPIGSPGSFTGRFDGLNYTLSNLTIKLGDYAYGGLFRMNDGTIENLEISGVTFTDAAGEWDPNAIGAVVGYNRYGTIKNVRNTGSMTLTIDRKVNSIGGIAGINDGTIENAYNAANISYDKIGYNLGGISGYNSGTIKNVSNSGTVTGVDSQQLQTGGIVGSNFSQGNIENASNTGNITGGQNPNSIAGSNAGTITDDTGGNTTPTNPTTPTDTTPTTPSGGDSGNGGNTGSTTPTNPTTPTEPTPTTPSGGNSGTTPTPSTTPITPTPTTQNSGGNTSGTGAITPAPLAVAERVILATVTETENIAAAAAAGARAEMSQAAAETAISGTGTAAPPSASAAATAPQGFTWTAEGLIAIANDVNPAPQDALTPQSLGHALSTLQHGSGEEQAPGETGGAKGLEEAIEAADLAIGTEIAETDREGKAGQENLARDNGRSDGEQEAAEEKDEQEQQRQN